MTHLHKRLFYSKGEGDGESGGKEGRKSKGIGRGEKEGHREIELGLVLVFDPQSPFPVSHLLILPKQSTNQESNIQICEPMGAVAIQSVVG